MMRVISRKALREFWEKHAKAEKPMKVWFDRLEAADWSSIVDVRSTFPNADAAKVGSGKTMTVFNVGGNNYRVVAEIIYEHRRVYIRRVLTHDEYSANRWKEQL